MSDLQLINETQAANDDLARWVAAQRRQAARIRIEAESSQEVAG